MGSSRSLISPLSAAALITKNLGGVLLRNVYGFAPILWSFGNQTPAPRQRRMPATQVLRPKSRRPHLPSTCRNFISSRDLPVKGKRIACPAKIGTGLIEQRCSHTPNSGKIAGSQAKACAILTNFDRFRPTHTVQHA
jgi:hypothetical protein